MTGSTLLKTSGSARPGAAAVAAIAWIGPQILMPLTLMTLPLEFTKEYFPLRIIELSRVFMVACLALFAAELQTGRGIRVPHRLSFSGLALFGVYAGISAAAVHSGSGVKTAAAIAIYFAFMVVVYNWSESTPIQWRMWYALIISSLGVAVVALILRLTNTYIWNPDTASIYHRVSATFADPNILARFLAFSTATSIVLFSVWMRVRWSWLVIASAAASAAALPFTYSRFGWVLFFLITFLAAALSPRRMPAFGLLLGVCVVFAAIYFLDPLVHARSALFAAGVASVHQGNWYDLIPLDSERRYLVVAGLAMFGDHTLFGVGFGNYQHEILTTYSSYILPTYHTSLSHTSMVTVMAELGLVGLALVVAILAALARESWRSLTDRRGDAALVVMPIVAGTAIFLDSQLTGRLFDEPYLWVFLGLLYTAQSRIDSVRT